MVQERRSVTRKKKCRACVATLRALGDNTFSFARYRRKVRMSSTPSFSCEVGQYQAGWEIAGGMVIVGGSVVAHGEQRYSSVSR